MVGWHVRLTLDLPGSGLGKEFMEGLHLLLMCTWIPVCAYREGFAQD